MQTESVLERAFKEMIQNEYKTLQIDADSTDNKIKIKYDESKYNIIHIIVQYKFEVILTFRMSIPFCEVKFRSLSVNDTYEYQNLISQYIYNKQFGADICSGLLNHIIVY